MIGLIVLLSLFILFSIFENSISEAKQSETDIKNMEHTIRTLRFTKLIFLLISFIVLYYTIRTGLKQWLLISMPNKIIHPFDVGKYSAFLTVMSLITILLLIDVMIRQISKKKYKLVLKSKFLSYVVMSLAELIFMPVMLFLVPFNILIGLKNENPIELEYFLVFLTVILILITFAFPLAPNILSGGEAPEQNLPNYSSIKENETTVVSVGYSHEGGHTMLKDSGQEMKVKEGKVQKN